MFLTGRKASTSFFPPKNKNRLCSKHFGIEGRTHRAKHCESLCKGVTTGRFGKESYFVVRFHLKKTDSSCIVSLPCPLGQSSECNTNNNCIIPGPAFRQVGEKCRVSYLASILDHCLPAPLLPLSPIALSILSPFLSRSCSSPLVLSIPMSCPANTTDRGGGKFHKKFLYL